MKRVYKYISFVALAALLAVSCQKEGIRVLPEEYYFAAISETDMMLDEPAPEKGKPAVAGQTYETIVNIPVMIASVDPVETIVTYEVLCGDKDNNAIQGEDFELVDPSATVVFDGEAREVNIQIKVKGHPGKYTGDRKFTVRLVDGGEVGLGVEKTCTVKISDLDHPLADILGTYNAKAEDKIAGAQEWKVLLSKDPKDITVVWADFITPFSAGLPAGALKVYGKVSEDHKTITFPLGQVPGLEYEEGDPFIFCSYEYAGGHKVSTEGEIVFKSEDKKTFTTESGMGFVTNQYIFKGGTLLPGTISWTKNE